MTINLYQLQHGMKKLNCLMDRILYQIFKDYFEYILKNHGGNIDKPSVKVYVN